MSSSIFFRCTLRPNLGLRDKGKEKDKSVVFDRGTMIILTEEVSVVSYHYWFIKKSGKIELERQRKLDSVV